jgi:hypothetical protein
VVYIDLRHSSWYRCWGTLAAGRGIESGRLDNAGARTVSSSELLKRAVQLGIGRHKARYLPVAIRMPVALDEFGLRACRKVCRRCRGQAA